MEITHMESGIRGLRYEDEIESIEVGVSGGSICLIVDDHKWIVMDGVEATQLANMILTRVQALRPDA